MFNNPAISYISHIMQWFVYMVFLLVWKESAPSNLKTWMPREELAKRGLKDAITLGAFTLLLPQTVHRCFSPCLSILMFLLQSSNRTHAGLWGAWYPRGTWDGVRRKGPTFTKPWLSPSRAKVWLFWVRYFPRLTHLILPLVFGPWSQFQC